MSIDANDLQTGVRILRRFGATKVWLFGSALDAPNDASDLDLACEGVVPGEFFRAAGELIQALGKPVDLIDLSSDSRLNRYVRSTGRVLYEAC